VRNFKIAVYFFQAAVTMFSACVMAFGSSASAAYRSVAFQLKRNEVMPIWLRICLLDQNSMVIKTSLITGFF